jgi:hypothetical protein
MKILSPFLEIFHAKWLKKTDAWNERIVSFLQIHRGFRRDGGKKQSDTNKKVKVLIF